MLKIVRLRGFMRRLKSPLVLVCSTVSLMVLIFTGSSYAAAASIAQGYKTTDSYLNVGMAASLSAASSNESRDVVPTTLDNKGKFVGIVTTHSANLVTLTSTSADVVVTTSGEARAFLTDANGVVKKGDSLTVSPLNGILMKADSDEKSLIGTALEDFSLAGSTSQQAVATDGSSHEIHISITGIELNAHNVASSADSQDSSFLKLLGRNFAGKAVNQWQVLTALIIFLLLLVVEGALVYGAVHSSISALGRNPLAHDAVFKQLFQVILAVLAVLAFGLATIYTILQI